MLLNSQGPILLKTDTNSRRTNAGHPPLPSSPAVRARKLGRWAAMVRESTVCSGWRRW